MTDAQYWQWVWINAKYTLLFGAPLFVGCCIWAALQYWYEDTQEDKDLDEHTTHLFQ